MPYILNCPISQYSFSFKIGATSRQTEGMFCISTPLAKEPKGPHDLKEPSLPLIATSKLLNFSFPEPDRGELDHKSFCSIFFFIRTRFFLVWVQSLYITLSVCMGCFQISFSDHKIAISIHSMGSFLYLRVGPLYKIRKKGAWYSMFLITSKKRNPAVKLGTTI